MRPHILAPAPVGATAGATFLCFASGRRSLVAREGEARSQPALRWSASLPAYKEALTFAPADSPATIMLPEPSLATSRPRQWVERGERATYALSGEIIHPLSSPHQACGCEFFCKICRSAGAAPGGDAGPVSGLP